MKKRIMTVLLCLVMVIGLLPVTAQAATTDRTIQLGTGSITGYSAKNSYDYLYIGNYDPPEDGKNTYYPIKWRVLDTKTNTDDNKGLFLLSDGVLQLFKEADSYMFDGYDGSDYHTYAPTGGTTEYHRGAADASHGACVLSNTWQGSKIQKYFQTQKPFFTDEEYAAIQETSTSDGMLNSDKLFYLSTEEASNSAYGFTDNAARVAYYADCLGGEAAAWCLRSPIEAGASVLAGQQVAVVNTSGAMEGKDANSGDDISRPAFNLDKSTVLFISAYEYTVGSGDESDSIKDAKGDTLGLAAVAEYAGNSWRPTLKDKERTFALTDNSPVTAAAGGSVTLNYTGAKVYGETDREYISAIIADSDNAVLYYGKLKTVDTAEGTVSITIPADLPNGDYKLHVFNEKCQYDGNYSDISSAFQTVALTVSGRTTPTDPAASADHTHHVGVNRQTVSEQPAADKLESPKTGDGSMMGLWAALMFVGAAGAVGTVAYSRRRRA